MATAESPARAFPELLRQFWIALLLLGAVAVVISHFRGTWVVTAPADFGDLLLYKKRFAFYGTPRFYWDIPRTHQWDYPSTLAIFYRFFYSLAHPVIAYMALLAVTVAAGAAAFVVGLRRRGISMTTSVLFALTCVLTSYPLWFLGERANLELFVIWAVAGGMIAYWRGYLWWAAALFGLATAMKFFPVIYLALFLSRKQYRQLWFGLAVAVVWLLGCSWVVGPTLTMALHESQVAMGRYTSYMGLGMRPSEIGFDHSLFTFVKHAFLISLFMTGHKVVDLARCYRWFFVVGGVVGIGLYVGWIRRLPVLNQFIALTICSLLLTPVSPDYRLVHLYVPWALFLYLVLDGVNIAEKTVTTMLFLWALVLTPQTYLYYVVTKDAASSTVAYGGQLKAIVLVVLLVMVLRTPLGEARKAFA